MARSSLAAVVACCTLFVFSGTVHAAPSFFSTELGYIAGAAAAPTVALTLEDFNSLPPSGVLPPGAPALPIGTPTGVTVDIMGPGGGFPPSIEVVAGGASSLSATPAIRWLHPDTGVGASKVTFDFSGSAFPLGINAFGIQIWNASSTLGTGPAAILTLTTADGAIITHTFPAFPPGPPTGPSMGYLGVIDKAASFVSVSLEGAPGTAIPDLLDLDNLRFGAVSMTGGPGPNVPEPTSMALFGLTALGLAFGARRRRKQAQSVENTPAA